MKGDFSRIRFNPANQYTAVLKQQGRVDLDSDSNEQSFIDGYIDGVTNTDVIGQYGGPAGNAGFAISISGNSILIGPGRYYVNGLLVENPTTVNYDQQPYLYNPVYTAEELIAAVSAGGSTAQFVLEVWQQLVTGLDDPSLLEPALGQADTTVRLKTVWRVIGKVISTSTIPAGAAPDPANPVTELSPCCQYLYSATAEAHGGLLSADTNGSGSECGCQPIAAAGYQGLENQLYRVEIHNGGALGAATFKWSRENASVVTAITNINGAVVTVSSLGPDANLGFQNNQWVELTDDTYTYAQPVEPPQVGFPGLAGIPGQLLQIQSINPATLQVTFATPVTGINLGANPRMRRWDQFGASATNEGVLTSLTPVPLEYGIEVTFSGGPFYPGDYWTIPARAAKGTIDWPLSGNGGGAALSPSYTWIYDAPLACMGLRAFNDFVEAKASGKVSARAAVKGHATLEESGAVINRNPVEIVGPGKPILFDLFVLSDCRLIFSPLTALNPSTVADAIHVTSISWSNDDVMTVDALVQNGLFVNFDQATTNPWGGGNFKVTMESPAVVDPIVGAEGKVKGVPAPGDFPPGTNIFGRSVSAVDSPLGITVNGTQVTWIAPLVTTTVMVWESYYLYLAFNAALNAPAPLGFARIRVHLDGDAIYANGPAGNLYLDGTAFGQTSNRKADSSPCVMLSLPSGGSKKSADFESWFYLAPSLVITSMAIQLLNSDGNQVGTNAITITSDSSGTIGGLATTANPSANQAAVGVSTINLVIGLSYAAVAQATINISLTFSGAANVVAVNSPITVNPGQSSVTVPVNVVGNPGVTNGVANIDTVTFGASISGLFFPVPFGPTLPTLVITGVQGTFSVTGIGNIGNNPFSGITVDPTKEFNAGLAGKDLLKPEDPKP